MSLTDDSYEILKRVEQEGSRRRDSQGKRNKGVVNNFSTTQVGMAGLLKTAAEAAKFRVGVREDRDARRQSIVDVINRRDVVNSLPEKFRTPEALARLNATLPPEERIIDANAGEVGLSYLGNAFGLGGDIAARGVSAVGSGVASLGNALAPSWVERAGKALQDTPVVQDAASATGELLLDFSDKASSKISQITEAYPRTTENLGNTFNIASAGLGSGLISQGAKANKGAWAAGVRNYIDNFYTNDKPSVDPTKLENTLGKIALEYKGMSPNNKANRAMAGKRATGIMRWGAHGAASAIDSLFNPYSRGLYRDTAISRRGQKAVDNYLFKNEGKPSKRDTDKAVAQVIYNRHIIEQSDRKGEIGDPLFEIEDFANLQGYKPDTAANFISGANATKFEVSEGQGKGKKAIRTVKKPVPEKVLKTAKAKIDNAWGLPASSITRKIIFKEPSGGTSGNHYGDLASKHPAIRPIQEIIAGHKGKLSSKQFYEKLREVSQKDGGFKVNKTWEEAKRDGIWVQAGMGGGSIVEGGVNGLLKVLPNGKAIGFMSDVHDFLEKLPIVGKLLEKTLPRELLAVSGPMHMDIIGQKGGQSLLEKASKAGTKREGATPVARKDRPDDRQILDDYVAARPTTMGMLRGFDPYIGTGLLTANVGGQQEE
jgi:hypothetical protein